MPRLATLNFREWLMRIVMTGREAPLSFGEPMAVSKSNNLRSIVVQNRENKNELHCRRDSEPIHPVAHHNAKST
jgi:hypothetical protein